MIKTREQKYAEPIYRKVGAVKNDVNNAVKTEKFAEDYSNAAKNLPALIRTAGLVQALHFAATRNDGSKKLISDLAESIGKQDKDNLLKLSREFSLDDYIRLTEQSLTALKWFKRFVAVHLDNRGQRK